MIDIPSNFRPRTRRVIALFGGAAVSLAIAGSLHAQTLEDAVVLPKQTLLAGELYTHDRWNSYWEGSLQRVNGNLGTVTTQSVYTAVDYGLLNRINVLAQLPYLWTHSHAGVLRGQAGLQDFSLAVKVNALQIPVKQIATLRAVLLASGSTPLTGYNNNLLPLSIGLQSRTGTLRGTLSAQSRHALYVNGTVAYTFRGNTSISAPYYYTTNQITFSNRVAIPNQFSYITAVGYLMHDLKLEANFTQLQTRGGGDIRRQDLPFVSNRTNSSRLGGNLQYPLPKRLHDLQIWFADQNTFDGRNVGQSNTITTGLLYKFQFERSPKH